MASTQIGTTTDAATITHGRNLVLAGTRLYAIYSDGTDLVYEYSDDDGVTWTGLTAISTDELKVGTAFYDADNGRMNFAYADANSTAGALKFRAITSNVASGTPGALTTETTIDAGGSNVGVGYPYAIYSDTGSNARYWIIAQKATAVNTVETRVWYVDAGSDADTGGNWVTTNFTNLGSNSGTIYTKQALAVQWTVSGADKLTFIFRNDGGGGPQPWEAVTFDPTAATPTPGSVTQITGSTADTNTWLAQGTQMCVSAKADYLVFGRRNPSTGWDFFKSVNGTTWANPTGWTGLTMGRCSITHSDGDFYLVHTASYGDLANSAQALYYRLITASSDNMGGVTAFSDTDGNGVALPIDTGTSKLYAMYRASTSSPYSVRSDFVSIGGAADTTAPGQASVTVSSVGDTTVDLSATMPADVDVAEYEVRYLTGATAPATNRSDGTVSTTATATAANAVVTPQITSLTGGTRITGRVYVKDTAGNWNTGATFTAVPVDAPTFVGRYKSDGVTAVTGANDPLTDILVYQLATSNMESGGANLHMRARVGTDADSPPTAGIYDIQSTNGGSAWQYKNGSDVWTDWPAAGLTSGDWERLIRLTNNTVQTSQFVSIRCEQ